MLIKRKSCTLCNLSLYGSYESGIDDVGGGREWEGRRYLKGPSIYYVKQGEGGEGWFKAFIWNTLINCLKRDRGRGV